MSNRSTGGPLDCTDCRLYYQHHRDTVDARYKATANGTDRRVWFGKWFARFHADGHTDPFDAEVQMVRTAAEEVYWPAGVDIFLNGKCAVLGNRRPIDMIRSGQVDEVLAYLNARNNR